MEANNWRPAPAPADSGASTAEPPSAADWRSQLPPDSRQRIVSKIMETLKRHLPISVPEGLNELHKIAVRFEEKIFSAAINQPDYLRKISLKMLSMESKTQNTAPSSNVVNQNPGESASIGIQPQANNQSLPMSMVNQNPTRQHIFQQNIPNNSSATLQNSANMPSALSSISGINQSSISSVVQTSNLQNMSGISQGAASNSVGRNTTDVYNNAQRQMQGRKQQQPIISQQQQPQNQLLYQQQFQQQLMKQKLQQPSLLQPHLQQQQQQQQQSLLQTAQLQSSQQPLMQMSSSIQPAQSSIPQTQPAAMQSTIQSGLQQNQLNSVQQSVPSMLHQHSQSVVRQQHQPQPAMHQQTLLQQQPTSLPQSSLQLQQHQQHLVGSQANNTQQAQLLGQQASITDMQQQPQSISVQQNNLLNMQQSQQILNQQNISLHQQQQLGPQNNNISVLQQQQQQQQQLLGALPSVSNMQPNQRSMHILQQSKTSVHQQEQLQNQQASMSGLQQQVQQSQQASQKQLMSQFQNQSAQLQQHLAMQQHKNSVPREMQQRLQGSGMMLSQNAMEQQKQFVQSQRGLPEVSSSTSIDSTAQTAHGGTDWQEEAYQKIKSMKDLYFTDLSEMCQKLSIKIQQQEGHSASLKPSGQYDRVKNFKNMLERMMQILQVSKGSIQPNLKDKLPMYEKQIVGIIASHKKKPPGHQQFQHSGGVLAQQQQSSQVSQFQQHDIHANQMQQMNLQGSASMQSPISTQQGSMPLSTHFGAQPAQQNLMSSIQSGPVVDQAQGSSFNPQQGAMGSMHQNGVISGQSTINVPQQLNPNNLTNTMQQQNLKQLQDQQQQQHLMQTQQMKQQLQQRHIQQQQHLMQQQHKHQLLQTQQSLQTQQKQQQTQMSIHQLSLHQATEPNELKVRQAPGMKSGPYQSHHPGGQRLNYYQQFKQGSSFPISSPQNPQVSSPQISHHSSPQIDQHNLLLSEIKSGTPVQSANSPFAPSPSTPLAPSPLTGETEKPLSGISPLSNGAHVGIQPSSLALPQVPSLSVATPGMSASPLLAEFASPDNQINVRMVVPNRKSAEESPLDRLLKLVGSSKPNVLGPAMNDISSVISMVDRIAGSAPGKGSRAAVGEDLVAMTKCRLQARNSISHDGNAATKKMKRDTVAVPLSNVTSAGTVNESYKQLCTLDTSELESTATSCVKQQKTEVNHALLEEIREINLRLIDTVIEITEENADSFADKVEDEGTVIRFSHTAVSLSPSLKSHFASANMTPIVPLMLLVPANYPRSSPVVLDKFPDESSSDSNDLSIKAKSRFGTSLRGLSDPMSIRDMVKTWDTCVRKVIVEYAEKYGGGCFSTRYGTWETA